MLQKNIIFTVYYETFYFQILNENVNILRQY